jgi:hypothetical protein
VGTGYDASMLANLAFVTRPEHEINREEDAQAWVGLPGYDPGVAPFKVVVNIATREDRDKVLNLLGIKVIDRGDRQTVGVTYPPKDGKHDLSSIRVTDRPAGAPA